MITPLSDWVLVELDPFEEKGPDSIILVGNVDAQKVRTATVRAVGRGKKVDDHRTPVGVEVGEKVAFLRWHLEHKNGKQMSAALEGFGENLGLIRSNDILFAYVAGEEVRVE